MGIFDDGGTISDAFDSIFGTPAQAAPMSVEQPYGMAQQAGIGDIGSASPEPPVGAVPPDIAGASSAAAGPPAPMPPAQSFGDEALSGVPGVSPVQGFGDQPPEAMPMPRARPASAPPPGVPMPPPRRGPSPEYDGNTRVPTAAGPTPTWAQSAATPPPATPSPPAQGRSFLNTMKDPLWQREVMGSLGAGLKAVGQNWNKPGLAAFAGTAGAAFEGGQKASDTGTEQKRKDTQQQLGEATLNEKKRRDDQMFQIYQQRLQRAQQVGTVTSRQQAWQESDMGRLTDARSEILKNNRQIDISYGPYLRNDANQGGNGAAIMKEMQAKKDADAAAIYKMYRVDPGKIGEIEARGTAAFGSDGKIDLDKTKAQAHKPTSWDDFHATVKPGQYFINPADGKLLQRKTAAPAPLSDNAIAVQPPNFEAGYPTPEAA